MRTKYTQSWLFRPTLIFSLQYNKIGSWPND